MIRFIREDAGAAGDLLRGRFEGLALEKAFGARTPAVSAVSRELVPAVVVEKNGPEC